MHVLLAIVLQDTHRWTRETIPTHHIPFLFDIVIYSMFVQVQVCINIIISSGIVEDCSCHDADEHELAVVSCYTSLRLDTFGSSF